MELHDIINKKDGDDFRLSPLPYTDDAFQPFISERIVRNHYYIHLQKYIDKVNLLKGEKFKNAPIEFIIKRASGSLYNNAAQVFNHYFYFEALSYQTILPSASFIEKIEDGFGSWGNFEEEFHAKAMNIFGSGWLWLVQDRRGKLHILSTQNGDIPHGYYLLLCIDMWEHAYYLDYKWDKSNYIKAFLRCINWNVVENRLGKVVL